jgi:glycosyltransferase involved in cell wall biosynthesis
LVCSQPIVQKKPSLLFVTTELPWPANSGGRIKTFRLVQFLSNRFEVNLVCAHGADDVESLNTLKRETGFKSVQVFGAFRKRTPFNWFMATMQFPTFNSFRVYSKRLESMLNWGIQKTEIVIIDHLEMFEMIPEKLVPKTIYHSHNAEFKLWQDYAELEKNPLKKWVLDWEADRVKLFERWVINKCKFTFAAPNDSEALINESIIEPTKFRLTYHLGNDQFLNDEAIALEANANKVFFGATLSWMPNQDGINWFLKECWPSIRKSISSAELIICGTGADQDIMTRMRQTEGVTYKGYVDDIGAEMSNCSCAIIPLRFGSGMKIKTFDAMYRGLPIVSTKIGVEGIDIKDGEQALVADSSSEFAIHVINILSNYELAHSLAIAARKLSNEHYTYERIFESMLQDLNVQDVIQQ